MQNWVIFPECHGKFWRELNSLRLPLYALTLPYAHTRAGDRINFCLCHEKKKDREKLKRHIKLKWADARWETASHTYTHTCMIALTTAQLNSPQFTSSQPSTPHIALIVIAVSCIYKNYENFLLKRRWHFTEMQNSPAAVSDMQTDRHTESKLDRQTYREADRKNKKHRHST